MEGKGDLPVKYTQPPLASIIVCPLTFIGGRPGMLTLTRAATTMVLLPSSRILSTGCWGKATADLLPRGLVAKKSHEALPACTAKRELLALRRPSEPRGNSRSTFVPPRGR